MASILGFEFPSLPTESPSSSSSSSSSIPESFLYDVFLSFRGYDTRNNFTGHLYDRLEMAGIRTFMDDPELRKGREISVELMRAIGESRIYIIVFSQNYASSKWCLNELVNIIDICNTNRHRVLLPVFYGIQPSDVRHQRGRFEEAFKYHEANHPELIIMWQIALLQVANISGFDLQGNAMGSESRLISLIIKEVLSLVKPKKLFVAKYPIGLDSRVNDVYLLLTNKSDNPVRLIGIWGMGGSGKTVVAKSLYNQILESFDSSCFLANVRENSSRPSALVHLQEKLICRLLMRENIGVSCIDEGKEMIKERLRSKKVLIVLDDTDALHQVDALAGHRDWFSPGSVIIITTRDRQLLNLVQVDGLYEPKELNYEESVELFSLHAFKTGSPQESYGAIARKIVAYSQGLPLALVVLGSYLGGRRVRPVQEWNSAVESLQKFPPNKIQNILKISYDGLDNDEQREIFLDIACFFIGIDIDYVTDILNGCNFSTEIGIGILKDSCLLTIDINNELRMHDLLRDMVREIIRQQCPREPGKRSRLWSHQEAIKVLVKNTGTEAIEGVTLVSPREEEIHLNTKNFAMMHNLRLLKMDSVNLYGGFEHLSKEIRWLSWKGYSLEHLPSHFKMPDLVVLDMQNSKMNTVWQDLNFFERLKILNLSHSKCLISTPDFRKLPNLSTLILEGCTSLVQIDPSIGCLRSLLILNMEGCENITNITSEICRLKLLGYINLSGCLNLTELPDNLGSIEFLRELFLDETAITQLPYSFYGLKNLTSLSLRRCIQMSGNENEPLKLLGFIQSSRPRKSRSLRRLNLRECNLSDGDIPYNIGNLSGLQELDLAGNSLSKLPPSFRKLTNLKSLSLDNWSILPPELCHLKPKSDINF